MCSLISIIIPIFNGRNMIDQCIQCWKKQTNKSFELIFIDDGSTDNSYIQLLNVQKENRGTLRIKVLQSGHSGVSRARNLGLDQATGDIIGFMDIDDVVHDKTIEYLLQGFKQDLDMICVYKKVIIEQEINLFLEKNLKISPINNINTDDFIYKLFFDEQIFGSVWNKYIKKDCLNNKRFLETLSMCEDTEYIYRVVSEHKNMKIGILPVPLYGYVQHENNVTLNLNKLFNNKNELKYCEAMNTMLLNTQEMKIKEYLKAKKFELLSTSCINKQYITKEQLAKMISESKKNFFSYIKCPGYALKHRIKQSCFMLLQYIKSR